MSTIEDFENAPVGATATREDGRRAMKLDKVEWRWVLPNGRCLSDKEMVYLGFTLDQPAPTTAREALALAWELAHPVKEGQVIPAGALCLAQFDDGYQSYETSGEVITSETLPDIRTFDPLPDPEPDWLDAPAVVAFVKGQVSCVDPQVLARVNKTGTQEPHDGYWRSSLTGLHYHWTDLIDVTPLYPKDES